MNTSSIIDVDFAIEASMTERPRCCVFERLKVRNERRNRLWDSALRSLTEWQNSEVTVGSAPSGREHSIRLA